MDEKKVILKTDFCLGPALFRGTSIKVVPGLQKKLLLFPLCFMHVNYSGQNTIINFKIHSLSQVC